MNTLDYDKWATQLRKGYLELCVLCILQQRETAYGLEILQALETAGLEVNEGTLYPLLNRMQRNTWLVSDWQTPEVSGHPRRFYRLSPNSKKRLPSMMQVFDEYQHVLSRINHN